MFFTSILKISIALVTCAAMFYISACTPENDEPTHTRTTPDWIPTLNRTGYVVDSISWYDSSTNHKEAIYEYDENNRLISRTIHSTYEEWDGVKTETWVNTIEYLNGHVYRITETVTPNDGLWHPDRFFYYDTLGRLVRYEYGDNVTCFAYRSGLMDSVYNPNKPEMYTTLEYDAAGNVVRQNTRYPVFDGYNEPTGRYEIRIFEYEYDNSPRPNFNTDEAFVFEPVFGMGTTYPTYVRILSPNNMTRYSAGPETWEYEYNAQGLPRTMYHQFANVVPTNHPVYKFIYRSVE